MFSFFSFFLKKIMNKEVKKMCEVIEIKLILYQIRTAEHII